MGAVAHWCLEAVFEQLRGVRKIAGLNAAEIWDAPIVTEVAPLGAFYPAEDYHQGYFRGNPRQPYCRAVVGPKVAKFRKQFAARLKP